MTDPGSSGSDTRPADSSGFFAALFDLDFKSFVALRFLKVIYVIALVFLGLSGVIFFFASLAAGEFMYAIVALFFLFFYLIAIRVWLEVIAVLFRIGEDTTAIRAKLDQP